jgi:hypothetical protein
MHALNPLWYEDLLSELAELDRETIIVDGKTLKPSQCYHVGTDPTHVLFNTNCPDELREKVSRVLAKYRL